MNTLIGPRYNPSGLGQHTGGTNLADSGELELSKAVRYAERYKSESFRKKMHLHNSVGLSGEFEPDSISKLHPPLTKAHIHWVYETGRVNGS